MIVVSFHVFQENFPTLGLYLLILQLVTYEYSSYFNVASIEVGCVIHKEIIIVKFGSDIFDFAK